MKTQNHNVPSAPQSAAPAKFTRGPRLHNHAPRNEPVVTTQSRTYGAYYLIRDCVVTTGSFLGAWLWSLGPRVNFAGAAVCGGLGTIWFWWFIYRKRAVALSP